ncbi:MAG: hypothetical protein QM765_26990 [Myxococcales bacterium]
MRASIAGAAGIVAVAALLSAGTGCVAAGAAAAGTAAGIAYSDRGAKGDLEGSASDVQERALEVFEKEGIAITSTKVEQSGARRVVEGKRGDQNVTVTMTAAGQEVTHVEATAEKSPVEWDKDLAKRIIEEMVRAA